jgi:hypothetical protein
MKRVLIILMLTIGLAVGAQTVPSYGTVKLTKLAAGTLHDSLVVVNGKTKVLKYFPISEIKSATNLDYLANPNGGTLISSTGNEASVPLATTINAGLLSGKDKSKIDLVSGSNTGDQIIPTTLPASDVYPWAKNASKPTYTATEIGLGNVDNTSDLNKPVSNATIIAISTAVSSVYKIKGVLGSYSELPIVGNEIGWVYNILDTSMNYVWTGELWDALGTTIDISGKADLLSPTFIGVPTAPTATAGTNTTQLATTAFVTGSTAIKAIDEGNGIGYVIANRDPLNYGNVGNRAVDLSNNSFANTTYGATGTNSNASGSGTTASGNWSTASGSFTNASASWSNASGSSTIASGSKSNASGSSTIASGSSSNASGSSTTASGSSSNASGSSTTASGSSSNASGSSTTASGNSSNASGSSTTASGNSSNASGYLTTAKSFAEISMGINNTIYTAISTIDYQPLDRLLVLGNGTDFTPSNALLILKNGLTTLPSVTNALITAEPTGKAVVTKQWAEERFKTTTVSSSTYFQNSTLVPTLIEGMTITPTVSGNYKVDFNGQFNTQLANITAQAVVDLEALYLDLNSQPLTGGAFPSFAGGTVITPGVYETVSAVTTLLNLTFDGQNNPNSIFIFRTSAALNSGAGCTFNLINGAKSSNIYFIAAAITLGAAGSLSATYISRNSDVLIGAGCYVNGRCFSRIGAITNGGSISVPVLPGPFNMGITNNFAMFTNNGAVSNTGNTIIVGDVGTNNGAITGFESATHSGYIYYPSQGSSNCQFSIYVDNTIVPTSTRERTNAITKEDVILSDKVTITAGQTISIKNTNSIGISRFYNRILTVSKI